MGKSQKGWILLAAMVPALLLLGTYASRGSGSLHRIQQIVESDGQRTVEHRYLTYIPYEERSSATRLHVTSDFFQVLKKTGIKPPSEIAPKMKTEFVIRILRSSNAEYCLRAATRKPVSTLIASIGKQLKPLPGASAMRMTKDSVEGICPDGHTRLSLDADPSSSHGGSTDYLLQVYP